MYQDYLILGGAGLVGTQVVRHLVKSMSPRRIVIGSLLEREAREACESHAAEFCDEDIAFIPEWGNLFVPSAMASLSRAEILKSGGHREELLEAVYGNFSKAYEENHLVNIIRKHRPQVIVDAVNTATGFSYQNVFDGATKVRSWIRDGAYSSDGLADLDTFLLSQSVPQLIRHVRFLHKVTTACKTLVYLKVGTTGTGGMGLNIPYTHSEDRPSKTLLAKNEAAFGHTGLLFLLARTPNSPIVKEVKPAAMIGYRAVQRRRVRDKHNNDQLYRPRSLSLRSAEQLELSEPREDYERAGDLVLPVVDTGENGVFTRGEFAAITALGQMEYVTPEEIARTIVLELRGANTGQDVISALDGSVLDPSYKAGLVRGVALRDLAAAEEADMEKGGIPSIALGRLGPPELSKLLFEAALIKHVYGSTEAVLADQDSAPEVVQKLADALEGSGVLRSAPSIGIPVLLPDGETLLRGPWINVPEPRGHQTSLALSEASMDAWANKGWIDLRPSNWERWRARIHEMMEARSDLRVTGSAAANIRSFMSDRFELGEVVAWIFNNEMEGYRIK